MGKLKEKLIKKYRIELTEIELRFLVAVLKDSLNKLKLRAMANGGYTEKQKIFGSIQFLIQRLEKKWAMKG